jgi:hypothetical protein
MDHVMYALFDDDEHARAALDEIEAVGTPRRHCAAVIHRGRLDEGQLGILESAASEGLREGAALGGIGGALLGGVLFGPAGLVSIGATALLGALYGGIGGAIAGSGGPDRRLERLSNQLAKGKVLLVVEAPDLECRDKADSAARANGAQVQHKPFL